MTQLKPLLKIINTNKKLRKLEIKNRFSWDNILLVN